MIYTLKLILYDKSNYNVPYVNPVLYLTFIWVEILDYTFIWVEFQLLIVLWRLVIWVDWMRYREADTS